MKSGSLNKIRILTDLRINQNAIWGEKTYFIEDLLPNFFRVWEGMPLWFRYRLKPLAHLLVMIRYHKKYDAVVTSNLRTGQLLGLFRKAFGLKNPAHILVEFMLDQESNTFLWKLKKIFQRYVFSSVDLILVSSTAEIKSYSDRFKLDQHVFRFQFFHTNIVKPEVACTDEGFVLSAGKTGRDYQTLAVAVRGLPYKVVVVSDAESVRSVDFPHNCEVLINIPREQYLHLLHNCRMVVVPLHRSVRSTGQVAFLEAMSLGKPVIATATAGTFDYIQSGQNGLLVPPSDSRALKKAIMTVAENEATKTDLGLKGFEFVNRNCTFQRYVDELLMVSIKSADKRRPGCS